MKLITLFEMIRPKMVRSLNEVECGSFIERSRRSFKLKSMLQSLGSINVIHMSKWKTRKRDKKRRTRKREEKSKHRGNTGKKKLRIAQEELERSSRE